MYTSDYTLHSKHYTLHSRHYKLHSSTGRYPLNTTLHYTTLHYKVHTTKFTLQSAHYKVHTTKFIVISANYKVYITLKSSHYIVYNTKWGLHSVHRVGKSGFYKFCRTQFFLDFLPNLSTFPPNLYLWLWKLEITSNIPFSQPVKDPYYINTM